MPLFALLAVAKPALCVVSFFASAATVIGSMKLGMETYEKYHDLRERRQWNKDKTIK